LIQTHIWQALARLGSILTAILVRSQCHSPLRLRRVAVLVSL
jgi:hypothetical protein